MKDTEGRWPNRMPTRVAVAQRPGPTTLATSSASGGVATTTLADPGAELRRGLGASAFAFRGYDDQVVGRSPELLAHPAYGPIVAGLLADASGLCSEALGTRVDLAARIRDHAPSSLDSFPEDVATIVAMEFAQVRLLEEFFGVDIRDSRLGFGYSIGELAAVVLGGVFTLEELLPIPLSMATDCAALAADVSLGVLVSRRPGLVPDDVQRLCLAISGEGHGLIGPSAFLAPNTALLLGQGDTLDRFDRAMRDVLPGHVSLRRKAHRWPPLHTPLVRQRHIPDRTATALYQIEGSRTAPVFPIVSSSTGTTCYDVTNGRELLTAWTDHPQRVWDMIDHTLAAGVERILHVGPRPTLIPTTFARLSKEVGSPGSRRYFQRLGRGVVSSLNRHPWLAPMLPARAHLLRAPDVDHIVLEDWLLEHEP